MVSITRVLVNTTKITLVILTKYGVKNEVDSYQMSPYFFQCT